jgi:hypothetical protein
LGTSFQSKEKPSTEYLFVDQKRKLGVLNRIKKQIAKFELTTEELGLVTT